jgi:DNA-binding transcriptional LysR family regulator
VPLCIPQLAASLHQPSDLAGATLLHARANRHEWQTWLRGAGLPDLQGTGEQLFDTLDMCVQSAERGQGVAIADAALFADLIASGKVVKPFDIEVDSGNAYFLTYPPERREQRSIRLFEEWLVSGLRDEEALPHFLARD